MLMMPFGSAAGIVAVTTLFDENGIVSPNTTSSPLWLFLSTKEHLHIFTAPGSWSEGNCNQMTALDRLPLVYYFFRRLVATLLWEQRVQWFVRLPAKVLEIPYILPLLEKPFEAHS